MSHSNPIRAAVCGRNLNDLDVLLRDVPVTVVDEAPEVVISYGGDGSLLGAERRFPGVPKFPLRDWRSNPKCPAHKDYAVLRRFVEGTLQVDALPLLDAETGNGQSLTAMNDICLSKTVISSAVRYRLWLGDELYRSQIVGDGLVVSTPFGSTGYYRSITHSSFRVGIGLAFNNSTEPIDHIVIGDDTDVRVQVLRGPAVLVADNDPQTVSPDEGDTVTVSKSDRSTRVLGLDIFRCRDCFLLRQDGELREH